MLSEFTAWLLQLLQEAFTAAWTFISDLFISLVDMLLGVLVTVVAAIPVPEVLSGGLQQYWNQLNPGILYFAGQFGLVEGLALIGAAYSFRLLRKVVTMFQW